MPIPYLPFLDRVTLPFAVLMRLIGLASVVALSGCSGIAPLDNTCPPLVSYDEPFQRQLATEMEEAGSAIWQVVADYLALRDMMRACRN